MTGAPLFFGAQSWLPQLRVLRLGLLEDGDVGIGVFPGGEKVLILSSCLCSIPLQLGFDDVGMGNFSPVFEVLCQLQKAFTFVRRFLGNFQFQLGPSYTVVILHHRNHQPPRGDLGASTGGCRCRTVASKLREASHVDRFMDIALTGVFVDRIIGDELDGAINCSTFRVIPEVL